MLQATETEARSPGGPGRSDSVSPETVSVVGSNSKSARGHCEDGDCQGLAFVLLMARTARLARKEQEVESGQQKRRRGEKQRSRKTKEEEEVSAKDNQTRSSFQVAGVVPCPIVPCQFQFSPQCLQFLWRAGPNEWFHVRVAISVISLIMICDWQVMPDVGC